MIAAAALAIAGCAGRRPVAGSQPPPLTPSPTPAGTEAGAKASTSAEPGAAPSRPGRSKPGENPAPAGYMEEGNASWYGEPFHGRRASNGEIYDMHKLTAAHRTLPFNSMVRVTNLDNGKSTVVRITDRGPFVANRIIDLSEAAAEQIGAIGPGVVPVRLEVLSGGDPTAGFFTVQVGAFRDENNADRLRDRLSATYSPVFIQQVQLADGEFYRVRVGKLSGEQAAQQLGDELRAKEGFTPFVVRLDDTSTGGGTP
ncbi:MAG TPA: septal ring lytic transglycosylase RlpA family protein [Terriglobales bacterium]|nr:septal ring lytic transglycosylase RlpA family protein [Terriglobales bacterium]